MNTEHTVSAAAQAQVKVVRNLLPSDARYDGLRFVVQMECVHDGRFHWDYPLEHRGFTCEECGAKGVNFPPRSTQPRKWAALPQGALEGAFRRNLPEGWEWLAVRNWVGIWGSTNIRVVDGDYDLAAGQAVGAALEAQKEVAK